MREFRLRLPEACSAVPTGAITIRADPQLWLPKVLEAQGLPGYEVETLACFLALVARFPTRAVFDVGANMGLFALLAAAAGHRDVVAFEPTPALASTARAIAADNGLPVRVEELALGSAPGHAELFLSTTTDASNSLRAEFRQSGRSVQVSVDTVDQFVERTSSVPGVMKIDTESTEPDVLRGATATLSSLRPWIICEVLPGWTRDDLMSVMAPHDYHWFHIGNELPLVERTSLSGDVSSRYRNWLFAPEPPDQDFWSAVAAWQASLVASADLWQLPAGTGRRVALDVDVSYSDDDKVDDRWTWNAQALGVRPDREGGLVVDSRVPSTSRAYLWLGAGGFDRPPAMEAGVQVRAGGVYDLAVPVTGLPRGMIVQCMVLQYSASERLTHQMVNLQLGANELRFRAHDEAASVRVAFRVVGLGRFSLSRLAMHEVLSA